VRVRLDSGFVFRYTPLIMANKEQRSNREGKKAPKMTLKEKRAAKRAKREGQK
jgi:hypothetical protein